MPLLLLGFISCAPLCLPCRCGFKPIISAPPAISMQWLWLWLFVVGVRFFLLDIGAAAQDTAVDLSECNTVPAEHTKIYALPISSLVVITPTTSKCPIMIALWLAHLIINVLALIIILVLY